MKRLKKLLIISFLSFGLLSCNKERSESADSNSIQVVATIGMIADIAREVAGEHAEVKGIIGEGVDPHLYKPTSNDLKTMAGADIVFYNGLHLEGKMGEVLEQFTTQGKMAIAVAERLRERSDYLMKDEENAIDPHVWMDVSAWILAVDEVQKALAKHDPSHAAQYKQNAESYVKELEALDTYAKKRLAGIPENQRILVTAHDAFGYMARAYGLTVKGIQGISTESEAGLKDIEDLVSMLVQKKIPAVFVESSVSDKNVKALVEGAKAQGHEVKIGGELFSDAMGETGTYEGTYMGMIDHNVTLITRSLGGTAPESGLNGKLTHVK